MLEIHVQIYVRPRNMRENPIDVGIRREWNRRAVSTTPACPMVHGVRS